MIPRRVWKFAAILASIRLLLFLAVFSLQSEDAHWQLVYVPFLVIDFPLSLIYSWFPVPWAEAILGPIWWFILPLVLGSVFVRIRNA
jgi:hypothetical protein